MKKSIFWMSDSACSVAFDTRRIVLRCSALFLDPLTQVKDFTLSIFFAVPVHQHFSHALVTCVFLLLSAHSVVSPFPAYLEKAWILSNRTRRLLSLSQGVKGVGGVAARHRRQSTLTLYFSLVLDVTCHIAFVYFTLLGPHSFSRSTLRVV